MSLEGNRPEFSRTLKEVPTPAIEPSAATVSLAPRFDRRPRRVDAASASADYLLSHAIEYLTDSRALPSGRVTELSAVDPDVLSVLVLMEARHAVYMACPVIERRKSVLLGMFKGPDRRKS